MPIRLQSSAQNNFRHQILMVSDQLAKWSLMYIFVIVALEVILTINATAANGANVSVIVHINQGFWMYLTAVLISFIVNHVLLALHRRSVAIIPTKDAVRSWQARKTISAVTFSKKCPNVGPAIVAFIPFLSFGLIGFGVNLNALLLTYQGAIAVLAQVTQRTLTYLFFVTTTPPTGLATADVVAFRFEQVTYYIFGIAFPVIQLGLLLLLWFAPLSLRNQKSVFVVTEIASAWASLEVFLIAALALTVTIQPITQLLVGNTCNLMNLVTTTMLNTNANVCLSVTGALQAGVYVSIVGAFLYVIGGNLILRASLRAIRIRERTPMSLEKQVVNVNVDENLEESSEEYSTPDEGSFSSAPAYQYTKT